MHKSTLKKKGFVLIYILTIIAIIFLIELLLIKVVMSTNRIYKMKSFDIKHIVFANKEKF